MAVNIGAANREAGDPREAQGATVGGDWRPPAGDAAVAALLARLEDEG
jgi:hypothetical protein